MKAFKAVETAKQGKETAVNNANKYQKREASGSRGTGGSDCSGCGSSEQVRINEAEAEVARFNAMYEEYVKNPTVTKLRMFYETMEDVLPGMKIVIDNGDGTQKVLPLDSFTGEGAQEAENVQSADDALRTQDGTTDGQATQGGE